jgi:hypothetical protein
MSGYIDYTFDLWVNHPFEIINQQEQTKNINDNKEINNCVII